MLTPTLAFSQPRHHLAIDLSPAQSHQRWLNYSTNFFSEMNESVKAATDAGLKLHQWLSLINSQRPQEPLKLTSPSTRMGFPIDNPKTYSPRLIELRIEKLLASFPASMKAVIFGATLPYPSLPEDLTDEIFIHHAYKLDRIYQSAVRWQTVMLPYKQYYKKRTWQDVRGYYDLQKIDDIDDKLHNFSNLDTALKTRINKDLTGLCINNRKSVEYCKNTILSDTPRSLLYAKFITKARKNWDSFFKLQNPRKDVIWDTEDEMKVIFADPRTSALASFLKDNIEDEFKTDSWSLKMTFVRPQPGIARLEFKSGVTPHVNKLGGNIITMDQAASIDEYDIKWTIRHEYGHVLGLPDCYFEFYDEEKDMGVSYQIDTSDLMCSRAGNFNQRIYKELEKSYKN